MAAHFKRQFGFLDDLDAVAHLFALAIPQLQEFIPVIDLGQLIEKLGPLNNQWRDGSQAEKALALWEMGEALVKSVSDPTVLIRRSPGVFCAF